MAWARGILCLTMLQSLLASQVTPIEKVLTLMNDMVVKATAEKKEEAVKFSAFSQWCDDQKRIKEDEIKAGNSKIEELKATIEKQTVEIKQLTDRIEELDEDVGRWNKDIKSIGAVRSKEEVDYQATTLDYTESIDALTQAIAVLKKQAYNRGQAELVQSLLQVSRLRQIPDETKSALSAYLQQSGAQPASTDPDERLFREAPEAYGYEFQSGTVVEMLEKLLDEFSTKKRDLEAEELTAQHAFEQMKQQLFDNIENGEHEIAKKTKLRAETEQAKAEAEGDLAATIKERDADQKYLDDMMALCAQKKEDFESRQALRQGELDALKEAIDIISSDKVKGVGERYLPSLIQKSTALAQLRSSDKNPVQSKIAAFLAEQGRRAGSRLLTEAAQQVASNPFVKVKKMIKDLIWKLQEEATSETEHKGWCDTELTTNKQTRDKKSAEITSLSNEIEDLEATIAGLAEDIAELTVGVKELNAAMAQATSDRLDAKAANEQTIKESKESQVAVEQAMAVLKDFYANSAEATAFNQQTPAEDAPVTFEKPYKGMLPEGGSVIDFLEVILSDMARLESETTAAEEKEKEDYDTYMFESNKDKALKENEIKLKSATRSDKESALASAKEELAMTQEALDKAIAYYEKLKPNCVDSGITYEERVKRREAEMQSLQEALAILAGTDISTDIR